MEGKIGGDAGLSERGLKYANALPDLIRDNIGDAPLTVSATRLSCPRLSNDFSALGLDVYPQAHHTNGQFATLSQVDLEIVGRARCGGL